MKYLPDVLEKFRALVAMYQAIGRGEEVEWVCPCPGNAEECPAAKDRGDERKDRPIRCVKDRTKICEGPGGSWRFVRIHALGKRSHSIQAKKWTEAVIREQARCKAEAWAEWLAEQEGA